MPELIIALPPTLDDTSDLMRREKLDAEGTLEWLLKCGFVRHRIGTPEDLDPIIRANPTAPMWTATRVRAEIPVAPVVLRPVDEGALACAPAAPPAKRTKRSKRAIAADIAIERSRFESAVRSGFNPAKLSAPARGTPEAREWKLWLTRHAAGLPISEG